MTTRTTVTLINVMTALTFDDNLVPSASNVVTIATMTTAPQSRFSGPSAISPPANPKTSPRYVDQLLTTVAAPTANSSTRSQPMIHATTSPKLA
jgi:hypothetical protein